MERNVEQRQPGQTSVASRESTYPRVLDPATDDRDSYVGPRTLPYSFWAECECPNDCLRDHANE